METIDEYITKLGTQELIRRVFKENRNTIVDSLIYERFPVWKVCLSMIVTPYVAVKPNNISAEKVNFEYVTFVFLNRHGIVGSLRGEDVEIEV